MSLKKDLKAILDEAENQGWRCELQKSGHWKLYAPDGLHIVVTGGTPGAPASLRNLVAQMRRYGFVWKGH